MRRLHVGGYELLNRYGLGAGEDWLLWAPATPPSLSADKPSGLFNVNLHSFFSKNASNPAGPLACVPARGAGLQRLLHDLAPAVLAESNPPTQPVWLPLGQDTLPLRLDLCTDFGPPDDDKQCNQDAAAFACFEDRWPGIVVALADGVSNSPYSEFGARLVVQTVVQEVPKELRKARPQDGLSPEWWHRRFGQVVDTIRQQMFDLWGWVNAAPGDFLPHSWRPNVFVRAVQQKNLFLSTMLVAVVLRETDDRFWGFLASVGDGSLSFCRDPFGQPEVVDALVCDVNTALDHSLGPTVERACFPRCAYARLGAQFQLGLATDGVGRALPMKELLLRFQQEQRTSGQRNVARGIIDQLKQECPEEVADNLSLAFLTRGAPEPREASASGA